MADKRLDQVTKVTDMAYVPVIMSDGSIGQIAKADLASVVAGMFTKGVIGNVNIDTINTFMWARIDGSTATSLATLPFGEVWFILIHIPVDTNNAIQIAINQNATANKIRTKWDGLFYPWNTL